MPIAPVEPLISNIPYYPPYFTNCKFTTAFVLYLITLILTLGYAGLILTILIGFALCTGLVVIMYVVIGALGLISGILIIVCIVLTCIEKNRYKSVGEPN